MPDQSNLVQAAMVLREQNTQAWDSFVMAVRQYSAEIAMDMVKAEVDKLQRAQGMAIMANEIAVTLMKAPELWEKIQNARREQARMPKAHNLR